MKGKKNRAQRRAEMSTSGNKTAAFIPKYQIMGKATDGWQEDSMDFVMRMLVALGEIPHMLLFCRTEDDEVFFYCAPQFSNQKEKAIVFGVLGAFVRDINPKEYMVAAEAWVRIGMIPERVNKAECVMFTMGSRDGQSGYAHHLFSRDSEGKIVLGVCEREPEVSASSSGLLVDCLTSDVLGIGKPIFNEFVED